MRNHREAHSLIDLALLLALGIALGAFQGCSTMLPMCPTPQVHAMEQDDGSFLFVLDERNMALLVTMQKGLIDHSCTVAPQGRTA